MLPSLRMIFLTLLFWSGLFVAWHQYSRLVDAAHTWEAQAHVWNFQDELNTIPGAFDGQMREDRPELWEQDLKGGMLVEPHKTNIRLFRPNTP